MGLGSRKVYRLVVFCVLCASKKENNTNLCASTAPTHMQQDKRSKKCKKKVANLSSTTITKTQAVHSICPRHV